jgi:alkanesulfonate monooxygenase
VDLLMLQFQPFEAEMRRFAQHVMPRVRTGAQAEAISPPREPAAASAVRR